MNCPNCKNAKGKPVKVHPISHRCAKCYATVNVDHTGKHIVKGGKRGKQAKSATS